ncbi:MAG TPA: DUF1552 domain-containing protein [Polyangiaceae bacterium]|nr:DUF1552 domain-containing protein [Polyangiaceae bacterium]
MKRQPFSRRTLLGGGAMLMGLPFLESIVPRAARAQAATAPVRLLYIYVPNGLDMATFRPETTGAGYATPPMLLGMDAVKSDFSVVTGLENKNGVPDEIGDHASGTGSFITCAHANKSETDIFVGVSADQLAAQSFGAMTRLPSLQLGIDGGGGAGNCDNGYSCAYTRNISWSGPSTPLPKIVNPQQAFEQLFAGFDPEESEAEAERRRAYEKSVIDAVLGDANSLRGKLGATDQKKLDEYLNGVRELEKRVVDLGPQVVCTPGTPPPTNDELDYPAHLTAMFDLMTLALACDATRVITLMYGNAISGRTHPFLGITGGHHDISHHAQDAAKIAQLATIGRWEMDQLGYFLGKLKETPDSVEGQNLLHNSVVFCSSDISDGNRHNHYDMPVILGGYGGGAFTPGRHIEFPREQGVEDEKVSNLLVTMLAAAGVEGAQLGDSSGPLIGL